MEPKTSVAIGFLRVAFSPLLRLFKRRRAETVAANTPKSFTTIGQASFDDVLRRISAADPNDAIFELLRDSVTNRLFTPDFLRTPSVQAWLAEPGVRRGICSLAQAALFNSPAPTNVREEVEARYRGVALANSQESEAVVDSVVAMLAASVTALVSDKGTGSLVVSGTQEVTRALERINDKLGGVGTVSTTASTPATSIGTPDGATVASWSDAFRSASTELLRWPMTVGGGSYISRPELNELLGRVQANEPGVLALLGAPGSGKSALLAKLAHSLSANGKMPVLAIKGDLLDPEVESEESLQQSLRLPELPSKMLRRLALAAPVALLVDQLDALAGHLDTKTGRLSVLLNLIKAVGGTENVFVFLSCRAFEFTHDVRLSRIDAISTTLELPPWEDVLPVLEAHGVHGAGFNSDARAVLRVPQHLSAFLQLRAAGVQEPVSNYTAMLDRLWSVRVLGVPGAEALATLAFDLAEMMAEKEVLWLAAAKFDDRIGDINKLKAAGILTTSEQGAIGFSHQTVFEHVLARSFAKNEGRLSAYALAKTDSLFVRPKVWAALAYLRSVEQQTYETELTAIWNSRGLRKHLRFLLLEFMGSQPEPTDKEELLLAGAGAQTDLRPLALKSITGSPGWFARLSVNLIAQSMLDERTADLCVPILSAAWSFAPDRVSALICEHWVPLESNDRRALYVLQEAPKWTPSLIEATKTVAGRSHLHPFQADHLISTVGASEPNVAIHLLRHILDCQLARCMSEAFRLKEAAVRQRPTDEEADVAWHMEHSPFGPVEKLLDDSQSWDSLPALAIASPREFTAVLWPWYLSVFRALDELSRSDPPYLSYPLPYRVDFRFEGESKNDLEPSSLLAAIICAISELARTAPDELRAWAEAQWTLELAPIQRLVAHALSVVPASTSTVALRFLLTDERRYFLGGVSDSSSTTRSLVAACAPLWSADDVAAFVAKVRAFSPARPVDINEPNDIKRWHRMVKRTRLTMLGALPASSRPPDVQRELTKSGRAAPAQESSDDFASGWIGARMNSEQFARASTEDIVSAFKEIPDASDWDHPRHFARGGNIQLSRQFAEFAKKHPERATEVIALLQPGYAQRAVGYAIDALAEHVEPGEAMNLIVASDQRGFQSPEFRQSAAHAVERLLQRDARIDDALLRLFEEWVLSEVSGTPAKVEEREATTDSSDRTGFLLSGHASMRVVPSGDYPILSSIIRARMARREPQQVIRILRTYLESSTDPTVWEFLADHMAPLGWEESGAGAALIGDVLSRVPLVGTRSVAVLMAKAHWKALDGVLACLPLWRDSPKVAAQKGYGELVALLAVANPDAHQAKLWLGELLDAPDAANARAGATSTAVQLLWPEAQFRSAATDLLLRLLERNEVAVWREVFGLFTLVDKLEPEPSTLRLVQAIAERIDRAPAPTEPHLVERLVGLLPLHAGLVARIATQLIQLWRDQLSSAGSSLVTAGQEIMDLALTLHRTEGTRLQGLQMFEQLVEIDAYQAREVLDELDHRVRLGARPMRPRLHRRGRGRRRVPAG